MSTWRRQTAVGAALALSLAGCGGMRENTGCKVASFLVPAALGGVGGGLIASEAVNHGDSGGSKNWEIAGGTAAGVVAGGLVGLLLGHFICREEAPPPPPPPPPPPAPPAKGTKIAHIPGANFEFNKSNLTAEGRSKIHEASDILKQYPNLRVSVDGYTDSIGSDSYNQRLSERRAKTVADALVADGISASRLDIRGFGKTNPIADNKTAAGRAENRRVEIIAE